MQQNMLEVNGRRCHNESVAFVNSVGFNMIGREYVFSLIYKIRIAILQFELHSQKVKYSQSRTMTALCVILRPPLISFLKLLLRH